MNTTTVTATYKGERVYVGYAIDLNLRTRLSLSMEPVALRPSHAAKVARIAVTDPSLTNVAVA